MGTIKNSCCLPNNELSLDLSGLLGYSSEVKCLPVSLSPRLQFVALYQERKGIEERTFTLSNIQKSFHTFIFCISGIHGLHLRTYFTFVGKKFCVKDPYGISEIDNETSCPPLCPSLSSFKPLLNGVLVVWNSVCSQ